MLRSGSDKRARIRQPTGCRSGEEAGKIFEAAIRRLGRAAGLRTAFLLAVLAVLLPSLPAWAAPAGVFREWDAVEKLVRDNAIPKEEARRRLVALHPALLEAARPAAAGGHRFPVAGGAPRDVGGRNGSGYAPAGYDYYAGQLHAGHPAHDIFIRDRNRDSRDDATGKPVAVLSFSGGVVVALSRDWDPRSRTRGGKVVWIFDPAEDAFYCYAHLREAEVELGARVLPGDVLGSVGRTGMNAAAARSPTHLHFMRLDFDGGRMTPRDTWRDLLRAAGSPPAPRPVAARRP